VPPLEHLVACPHCDTLHVDTALAEGARAHCAQCGAVIQRARASAIATVLSLALASFMLMIAAVSLPFLDPVSYTQLTLPTILRVYILVVASSVT